MTLSTKSIAQINNIEKLSRLSYQTAKGVINKMDIEQCQQLFAELQKKIEYVYGQLNQYVPDKRKYCKLGPNDEHYIVDKASPIRPKDFNALLSGVKKLEVLYGYFFDRLNNTNYSEVR